MEKLIPVLVPLLNPNETDALLAALKVKEGQKVDKGGVIADFETTKASFELTADSDGFFIGLTAREGDVLKAGSRLGYLADNPDMKIPAETSLKTQTDTKVSLPGELRITKPALALARARGILLESLPKDRLITETFILELTVQEFPPADPDRIVIYGGGGHAKSLIDLIRSEGKYKIEGILDDALPVGTHDLDVPVLGGGEHAGLFAPKGYWSGGERGGWNWQHHSQTAGVSRNSQKRLQCGDGGASPGLC